VSVDGTAAALQLATTSQRPPKKFTVWAGEGELWFWGAPCLKDDTTQVGFCRDRFSPTGELGYSRIRGAVGLGYRSTV
jgi:hypothetical protein